MNGDPSLERAEGSGPTLYDLAMQLAGAGVRQLTGPLQLQSSNGPANAVYPAAWSSRHQGRIFAPLVGPLTLHENIVWITVQPGKRAGPAGPRDRDRPRRYRLDGDRHRHHPLGPALAPRAPVAGRWRVGRHRQHRRPRGTPPAHGRDARPPGGPERRVGQRAQARRDRVEPVALHRRAARRADRRSWPRCPRRRSTRSPARSTAGASTSGPSCCSSGPAAGTAHRRCSPTTSGRWWAPATGSTWSTAAGSRTRTGSLPTTFVTYLAKFPMTPAGPELPDAAAGQRLGDAAPPQQRLSRRRRGAGQDRHARPGIDRGGVSGAARKARCWSR